MYGRNSDLSGGQELTHLQQKDFDNGTLLQRIIDAVNSVAKNLGSAAVGKLDPPPPIQSIAVQGVQSGNTITAPSEILHWTMNHTQEVQKGIHYFSEIDTNPNFSQPHVIHHGTSRSGFLTLPTLQNDGKTQNTYYLRSYSQYPGSDPQKPTVLGGLSGATKIVMTGTSATTLLGSTGSGTASNAGTQGAKGLGVVLTRPAPTTKRSI
jgi:hypothetical protein